MLIPAAVSLILSIIFLNFSLLTQGGVLLPGKIKQIDTGRIMGVSESLIADLPALPQPPNLGLPMERLPESHDMVEEAKNISYDLPAENGAILNCQDNDLFYAKRPDRQWPIASITKLFTAYTFLDYNPGWDKSLTIVDGDRRDGGKIYLFSGDTVKVKDLFYLSLVGSDNTATAAMVRSTGFSEQEFVQKMNDKIKEAGLKNTRLVDPVGLKDGNVSTAREVAEFARLALANQEIKQASITKKYDFFTAEGKKKSIASTNELLKSFPQDGVNILGGKTGYVNSSGYCFVGQFENLEGKSIVTVVLGAGSDSDRFDLTKKLVELYFSRAQ